MTRAARAITGLILALVCVIDLAMTIAVRDPTLAGQAQWLLRSPDRTVTSLEVRASSSPSEPVRRQTATSPTDAQTAGAEERGRIPILPSPSPEAELASAPKGQVARIKRRSGFPGVQARAPLELAHEKAAVAPDAIQAPPPAPTALLERPFSTVTIRLDASGGLDLPAPAHLEVVLRGDDALAANARPSNMGAVLDRSLTQYWNKAFDFIEPRSVSASFDAQAKEAHLVMDGVATLGWKGADDGRGRRYEADGHGLGWNADDRRPGAASAGAPDAVPIPAFEQITETIVLPNRGRGFTVEGPDVEFQAAGRAFRRSAAITDGLFTVTASLRSLAPDSSVSQSPAGQAVQPNETFDGTLFVRAPANYERTPREVDAVLASSPATLRDCLTRGNLLMRRGRSTEAIADFEQATLLDPASSGARAGLAVAEAWSGDEAAAAGDLDKAVALDPSEPLLYDGRAILSQKKGKAAEAVADYGQALAMNPNDDFARERRSVLEVSLGRTDAALADTAELLRTGADPLAARLLRVQIFVARHQLDDALREADAAIIDNPDVQEAYVLRGVVLAKQGKTAEAQAQFARSLTLRPTAEDFAWVRAQPGQGSIELNELCWTDAPAAVARRLAPQGCASPSMNSSQANVPDGGVRQASRGLFLEWKQSRP